MSLQFNHINLVVGDPEAAADFYIKYLTPEAQKVWLGDSLHVRGVGLMDLAFQKGTSASAPGGHHGFLASSRKVVDDLVSRLEGNGLTITELCNESDFRSVKFLDLDGYEIEVYWEPDAFS